MKQPVIHTIPFSSIKITEAEISKMIGYSEKYIPEMVRHHIRDILSEIGNYCNFIGGYTIVNEIRLTRDSVILEGITFCTDKIIAASLKKAEAISVFVCTAGENSGLWIQELLMKDDPVKAYIADIAASLIVEKATDHLQHLIEQVIIKQQKQITNRYSPGYCGWDVSEQHRLFSLLPKNFCGISLNEAALMHPIKSVSGIIGIGVDVKKTSYQCNKCDKEDCLLANKTDQ